MGNINIAFNTIIYIMVFLFPGILFRRAFFSGKFGRHFDAGNPFERLMWAILLSIICITLFLLFVLGINYYSSHTVENWLTFRPQGLLDNFRQVYSNNYPDLLTKKETVLEVAGLLGTLYLFSLTLGYSLKRVIFTLGLNKSVGFLQFQNSWSIITESNPQNNGNYRFGDLSYTRVDVKTSEGHLVTGELHDILLDKEGKMDAVAVKDTYKFVKLQKAEDESKIAEMREMTRANSLIVFHMETDHEVIFKKRIKGHIFTIFQDRIENISITYVRVSHFGQRMEQAIKAVFTLLFLVTSLFCLVYMFWDFNLYNFVTIYKRIAFCLLFPINVLSLSAVVGHLVEMTTDKKWWPTFKDKSLTLLLTLFPYFYIFDYWSFWTFCWRFLIFFVLASILLVYDKQLPETANVKGPHPPQ